MPSGSTMIRPGKAVEQLQTAQAAWSRKRTEHLDWICEQLHRERHAEHTFEDVDTATREHAAYVTGKRLRAFGECGRERERERSPSHLHTP